MNVLTVLLSISCIPREWADYSAWSWNIFRAWIWKSWWCKLHNWSINHTGPRKQFIGNIKHDDWATGMLCSHLAVNLQLLSRIKAARLQLWIPFGNKISFWLQNYGPWFDIVPAGIYSVIVDGFMQSVHDISSGVWTYQVVKYIFTQLHINQPYQTRIWMIVGYFVLINLKFTTILVHIRFQSLSLNSNNIHSLLSRQLIWIQY